MPICRNIMKVEARKQLHFLMIPLMFQGHVIPMVDIARLLAKRERVTVTIVTTPLNSRRFEPIIERDRAMNLDIRLLSLPFPHSIENVDSLPSPTHMSSFLRATCLLQKPLEKYLAGERGGGDFAAPINCIVSDKNLTWTAETARRFDIPRILFDGMSCFSILSIRNLHFSRADLEKTVSYFSEKFPLPGLPGPAVELSRAQLPGPFNPSADRELNLYRENTTREGEESEALGYLVNSFDELEKMYAEAYRKTTSRRIWCVGPASLVNETDLDKAERGDADDRSCTSRQTLIIKWLDAWESRTVVYACLGSMNRLTLGQTVELGLGLERSRRPFVWVVRGGYKRDEIESWLVGGFEERTKDRGLILRGWAPQASILSHVSVGAFVTHCGWNSVLEGISGGVPMLTWPMFGDQFMNEALVVRVLGIGVGVGAESVVHLGEEEESGFDGSPVTSEKILEGLEKLLTTKEGRERREKVEKLSQAAKMATVECEGSSYSNITLLLQDVMRCVK